MRHANKLWIAAVVLFSAAIVFAEPVTQLHPSNYVNDFAHVLSDQTVTELNGVGQQLDDKAHAQIAVVTINSLDGRDIESYANDLLRQWGVGGKSTNRGVLILLAVKDRRNRTEVGYGLEPILPDGKVGAFGREAVPLLKQGDYDGAVQLMTMRVANVVARDAGIKLTGARQPAAPQPVSPPHMSLGSIVALIILAIIVLSIGPLRRALFWMLLFNSGFGGSRGGSSWGGGGFGGGGGGFGGFGGGSSGGGGASGSW